MASVRINICLPEELLSQLKREVLPRETSKFITAAVRKQLDERYKERLAAEYRAAAAEIQEHYNDLEGTLTDGIH
jgi:metal-responsive CopG/Arc/MetJ family transcriptional regulator